MANCSNCSYTDGNKLVTIGFLKNLVKCGGSVNNIPSSVVNICCDNVDDKYYNYYVPKYSEIPTAIGTTRGSWASNPEQDTPGFIYSAPTFVSSNCCSPVLAENQGMPVSNIVYQTTSADSVTFSNISYPSRCNPSYGLTSTSAWTRYVYDYAHVNNGIPSGVTSSESIDGTLTKNISPRQDGTSFLWDVSFESATISREVKAPCSENKSASITFSLGGYSFGFNLDCSTSDGKPIPCEGGSVSKVVTVSGSSCSGEFSVSVTADTSDATISYDNNNNSYSVSFGKNNDNHTQTKIIVTYTINGTSESTSCAIQRDTCEWSPKYTFYGGCGVFSYVEDGWNKNIHEHQHDF